MSGLLRVAVLRGWPTALVVAAACTLAAPAAAQFLGQDFVSGNAQGATAAGTNSTAIGVNANANGDRSLAIGENSIAVNPDTMAIGFASNTTFAEATSIGISSQGNGAATTAVGFEANTGGANSTAIGHGAQAFNGGSTAVGQNAVASASNSTAIGQGTAAAFGSSMALGVGAATTRANQVAVGTAAETYTFAGLPSAASTAAQSGPTQIVTTDASGNLAAAGPGGLGLASSADVRRNESGIAAAMALSGIPETLPDSVNYAASVNWGGYQGQNAVAVGGSVRLTDMIFANGGATFGTGNQAATGGRAGVTVAW